MNSRLRSRSSCAFAVLVLVCAVLIPSGLVSAGTPPSGCADISGVAPFTQIRYTQLQSIFDVLVMQPNGNLEAQCTSCHRGSSGPAGLGLGAGFSYANLVGIPSGQVSGILRVDPGNPIGSLLFQKLNCTDPFFGVPMPPDTPTISITQQALFYDWIRLGAPLSRLGFEDR